MTGEDFSPGTHLMKGISSTSICQLGFSKIGTVSIAEPAFSRLVWTVPSPIHVKRRELIFDNIHIRGTIRTCYCANGKLNTGAIERKNHFICDHRTGESKTVDPNLLNLRHSISAHVDPHAPISIISGYRFSSCKCDVEKMDNRRGPK